MHVRDIAAANLAALTQPHLPGDARAAGAVGATANGGPAVRTYNVASGDQRTVLEMATALARALGGPEPVVTGQFRLGDVRHVTADTARIRAELGWQPAVDFEDGMAELARA